MALTAIQSIQGNTSLNDVYKLSSQQMVVISCNNRLEGSSSIKARLLDPLRVSVNADWAGLDSIMGGVSSVIGAISAITVSVKGFSISQPWFSRKFWKSTSPVNIQCRIGFFASSASSAYSEVYLPVNKLIGLVYPRKLGYSGSSSDGSLFDAYAPPGPNLYTGYSGDEITSGVVSDWGTSATDYVTFSLGNLVQLDICYLDSVSVDFSAALNSQGYPLSAACNVSVTAMDVGVWQDSGVFLKQKSGMALNVSNAINSVQALVSDTKEEQGKIQGKDEETESNLEVDAISHG